jgi:hypothetical protein
LGIPKIIILSKCKAIIVSSLSTRFFSDMT